MDRKRSLLVPLTLVTLACILAVEGGYRLVHHFLVKATAALQQQSAPAIATTGKKSGGLAGQQIILARNLFAARPGSGAKSGGEASAGGGSAPSGGLEVVLMGTVLDAAGGSRAVFLDKKSGRQELYRQGDRIEAGRIEEIGRGRVVVREGERRRIFDLREAANYRPVLAGGPEKEPAAENPPAMSMPAEAAAPAAASENGGGEGKVRRSFRLQRAAKATP